MFEQSRQAHRLGRRYGDCKHRLAGGDRHQLGKAGFRQIGIAKYGIRAGGCLTDLRAAKLLREGQFVKPHIRQPGDQVSVVVEQGGVAGRRTVEEDHGKVLDAGLGDGAGDIVTGRIAAAHRKQRCGDAMFHRIA